MEQPISVDEFMDRNVAIAISQSLCWEIEKKTDSTLHRLLYHMNHRLNET